LVQVCPANWTLFQVEPRGFEPPTSAVQRWHEGLQGLSGTCKTPANSGILMMGLFSLFRSFTQVAARLLHRR
jgi:hypothetical protein